MVYVDSVDMLRLPSKQLIAVKRSGRNDLNTRSLISNPLILRNVGLHNNS